MPIWKTRSPRKSKSTAVSQSYCRMATESHSKFLIIPKILYVKSPYRWLYVTSPYRWILRICTADWMVTTSTLFPPQWACAPTWNTSRSTATTSSTCRRNPQKSAHNDCYKIHLVVGWLLRISRITMKKMITLATLTLRYFFSKVSSIVIIL